MPVSRSESDLAKHSRLRKRSFLLIERVFSRTLCQTIKIYLPILRLKRHCFLGFNTFRVNRCLHGIHSSLNEGYATFSYNSRFFSWKRCMFCFRISCRMCHFQLLCSRYENTLVQFSTHSLTRIGHKVSASLSFEDSSIKFSSQFSARSRSCFTGFIRCAIVGMEVTISPMAHSTHTTIESIM